MWYIPKRFIYTALAFFGILLVYTIRVGFSVAIVAMVDNTNEKTSNGTYIVDGCPNLLKNKTQIEKQEYKGDKYKWNSATQGIILSSFYYGYVVTQVPAGVLCDKLGSKWLFGGGVLLTTALYLLIPMAASWGAPLVIAIRIFEGLAEGLTFPAFNHAISYWSPKFERSRMSTISNLGIQIGSMVGSLIAGILCSIDLFGGWPSTFYLFGTIGCAWFVLWYILAYETPESHSTISKEELLHITQNRGEKPRKDIPIPWKDIFRSLPMWAIIIAHFSQDYAFLMILSMMPTYFETVLHFDIVMNGFFSSLPYACQAISALLASYCADKLRESNKMSATAIRKVSNTIGLIGPALCCLGITVAGCNSILIVILLCLAMGLNGFIFSGYNVTHIDMSPDFAGVLYGITSSIANTAGIISPTIVGLLTVDGGTVGNWNKIFYITSAVYIVGGMFYAIFASAEVQPWGTITTNNRKETQTKDKIFYIEPTS